MGENLYNAVKDFLDGEKINFQLTDDKSSGYNIKKDSLYLSKTDIESGTLLHELFHVYQVKQERGDSFQKAAMNREIEANFAQYQYYKQNHRYKELTKRIDRKWAAVKGLDYYFDSHGRYIGDESLLGKDLFELQFEYNVVSAFKQFEYNGSFDNEEISERIFKNINNLTIDCN